MRMALLLSLAELAGPAAQAGVVATLHSFSHADGENPESTLVVGSDGNLYGTTYFGGAYNYGTAFSLTTNGVFTNLFSFDYTNGANPIGQLALGLDGNVYGTTTGGGPAGHGTVFRITTNGVLTAVASITNGVNSAGGLFRDTDGAFYGTTGGGGDFSRGTAFKFTSGNSNFSTLISFDSVNGGTPEGVPVRDASSQNFYGTAASDGPNGRGTVYRLVPNGAFTTLTEIFAFNGTNGGAPYGALVQGPDGTFYGTTSNGGTNGNGFGNGTVFSVTTLGLLKILILFDGTNGANPLTGLTFGPDGKLYGVTHGGAGRPGTLFQIDTNGTFSSLASLASPYAGLTLAGDGNLYGSETSGGDSSEGTLFRYIFNPAPPVIQSASRTGFTATLTWSSLLGCAYQLQYRTDLAQGDWLDVVGSRVVASGDSTVGFDYSASDPQRFYRVVLLVQ
ncbi:MAG TPA: choice-of-anchor tandem repeat GloVer-containing protein [Candidatus Acidoferrum sp.]|nr:choice-of-anchor tandem repeat GloVer-containing protein [Candidatus Acidoferrum sp.]